MLRFCQDVDMPEPERMTGACKETDLSKSPSELIGSSVAHAPNCSVWLIADPSEKTDR